ncbi:DUF1007 family protein [Tianweitania sp. BSSL-BM11]|uniref:DUF1007 family protein n=1 Tax=Tianweitania aestuarii TaxID=2814886 RepID=A0ABS5RWB1_9HYPH|nr:DUF1007 family protein [Tianweitania aestuarii]MBS9721333.1 DUF1007 family protein [Tianweitania aestuarii]
MRLSRRVVTSLAALGALAASTTPAFVHPHIFAEARLDVVIGADNKVQALQHVWRFDDLFSSTVLVEFDANKDLKLDHHELEEVGKTVHESLAEYNYFQVVTQDGKDVKMVAPDKLIAMMEDNQLIIVFESKLAEPLPLKGKLDFGVYDPTFYTAIDFVDDHAMAAEHLPKACSRSVIRPDPDEAIAANQSTLTDAFFNDPTGTDMSKIFATKLELNCTAAG